MKGSLTIPKIPSKFHNLLLSETGEFIATSNPYFIFIKKEIIEVSFNERFINNKPFIFGMDSVVTDSISEIRTLRNFATKLSSEKHCETKFNELKQFIYENSNDAYVVLSNQEEIVKLLCKLCKSRLSKVTLRSVSNVLEIIMEGMDNRRKSEIKLLPKNTYIWRLERILSESVAHDFEICLDGSHFDALWNDNFTIRICKSGLIEFISPKYNCTLYIKGKTSL